MVVDTWRSVPNRYAEAAPARFDRGEHRSLRSAICDAIRSEIIDAKLEPGKLLIIKELQMQFRVGLSAVREALCQLATDGLVIAEDQRGFRVAPISPSELQDLTRARVDVEAFAIRDAIAQGNADWDVALRRSLSELLAQAPRSEAFANAHRRYHDLLVEPCTSAWMKRFRITLHQHSERYRRLAANYYVGRDVENEHRALLAAALDRDADRAAHLIAEHVQETARNLLRLGFIGDR